VLRSTEGCLGFRVSGTAQEGGNGHSQEEGTGGNVARRKHPETSRPRSAANPYGMRTALALQPRQQRLTALEAQLCHVQTPVE